LELLEYPRPKESADPAPTFAHIFNVQISLQCDHLYLGTGVAFAKVMADVSLPEVASSLTLW
jgi:hypothetical protein